MKRKVKVYMLPYKTWFPLVLMGAGLSGMMGCGLSVRPLPEEELLTHGPRDHFIEIQGVRFHYLEYPGKGDPVFLLHGFASSTYTWEGVIPHLTEAGHPVWALDMKGFGWSDKPQHAAYDPLTLMEEVNQWMEAVGLRKVVFVGNSLGGAIGWLMALEHPDKVGRLILVDAAGYPIQKPFPINLAAFPLAGPVIKLFFSRAWVRWGLKKVYYHKDWVTEAQVNAYLDRLRAHNGLDAQVVVARALDPEDLEAYIQKIPSIPQETLLIWGREDEWIPLDKVGYRFNREIPRSRLVVIQECGHIPQEEHPEKTARLIERFVLSAP
ncbi:MAG: alpha/beta hydrolase [Deltaproteobacteria bacterium]|nr:alpha/beta hydrolase [Deltaproteobacteria bacterium]